LGAAAHLLCLELCEGFFGRQTFAAFKLTEGTFGLVVDGGAVFVQSVFVGLERFERVANRGLSFIVIDALSGRLE